MILHLRLEQLEGLQTRTVCGVLYTVLHAHGHTSVWYKDPKSPDDYFEENFEIPLLTLEVCEDCIENPKLALAELGDTEL